GRVTPEEARAGRARARDHRARRAVALASGALGFLAGPLHERGEEAPRRAVAADHLLRVPLHTDDELIGDDELDTFDDRVGRPRHGRKPSARSLDGLVVEAVHVDVQRAENAGEPRAVAHLHVMGRDVSRLALEGRLAVIEGRARLAGDVLIKAAAERDVEYLKTPAHGEQG